MRIDAGAANPTVPSPAGPGEPESPADMTRLENLWNERRLAVSRNEDYPIGPGDVLTVSVPDVEQLAQRRVRVSARGTIVLPLLGSVQVGGLSEDAVAAEIDAKLQKYMYQPEANVFVDEYHNRAVAVMGAVHHPGLVLLTGPSESLLDVITQAGGLSGAAADELILIPARPGTMSNSVQFASGATGAGAAQFVNGFDSRQAALEDSVERTGAGVDGSEQTGRLEGSSNNVAERAQPDEAADLVPSGSASSAAPLAKTGWGASSLGSHDDTQFASASAHHARGAIGPSGWTSYGEGESPVTAAEPAEALQLAGSSDAVTLNLKGMTLAAAGKYVNMPMRPGDVVIVPGGGDVMVVGWVHQPGRFQAGSGLTVLGAIGAAGGPMYAAKTNSIALIRTGQHGGKITIPINMDEITRGQAPDLPVQANDVIDVPYSGLRIGPYIFYSILTRMGIAGPVIPY
jgi:protein involved in polysaccharide export with SLBB domain